MGVVTVHVVDDADPQQYHDFHCEVKLLISHMQYFTPYVQHLPGQDVELTVRCSLQTFGWLMAYVKSCITGVTPVMDSSNCIAILIASNFLQMTQLLKETLAYIADNILQLTTVADFVENAAGLDGQLLTQVAIAVREESLEALLSGSSTTPSPAVTALTHSSQVTDSASPAVSNSNNSSCDVLIQKLYKHKLEALLKEHQTTLLRCRVCQQLFSASSHKKLQCVTVAGAATKRLKELPLHQPDPDWRFQDFLLQQRRPQPQHTYQQQDPDIQQQHQQQQQPNPTSWKDLFWLTWGHVVVLYCQKCNMHFPAKQYTHCCYHPMAADFINNTDPGIYRCCGRPAWQPGMPWADSQGCTAAKHQVNCEKAPAARAVELLEHLGPHITEPYKPPPARWKRAGQAQVQPAGAQAVTGSDESTSSSRASDSHCDREVRTKLPLLVRMTNRSAATAASQAAAGSRVLQSQISHSDAASERPIVAGGSHAAPTRVPQAEDSSCSAGEGDSDDDDLFAEDLNHRSAELRQFMEAVRIAARARNRGGSLLGVGSISSAHIAAQVGVPLQATFSAGGAARPLSRSTESRSHTWSNTRQPAQAASQGLNKTAGSRVGGLQNREGISSSARRLAARSGHASDPDERKETGKSVAVANRTLLLEMVHEDDVYRMGLLMRKLDAMRLQPPPDGISRAIGPLSTQDVCKAVNATLFEGVKVDW